MPSDLVGTRIYRPDRAAFDDGARPRLRELPARRRDQPRAGQGPVGAARGDAGAPGHDRPRRPSRSRRRSSSSRRENPIEAEGTYPLPEAQVDRFMLKILLGLPDRGRGGADRRPLAAAGRCRRARSSTPTACCAPARASTTSTSTRGSSATPSRLVEATRQLDATGALPELAPYVELRGQPARLDQPRPRRPRPGPPARPPLRPPVRRHRAGARRPAPPPGPELRALADGITADAVIARVLRSSRRRTSRWPPDPDADRMQRPGTDLARIGGRGRPAPDPAPDRSPTRSSAGSRSPLARRVGGRMTGDHRGRGLGDGLELDRIRAVRARATTSAASTGTRRPGRLVPHVREDVPDRQLTAWLLLDHSAVDALRDGRPAQGRRGRGRRARRRALRRPPVGPARRRHLRAGPRARLAAGRRPPRDARLSCAPSRPSRPRRAAGTTSPARPCAIVAASRTTRRPRRRRLRLPRPPRLAAGPRPRSRAATRSSPSRSSTPARTSSSTSAS